MGYNGSGDYTLPAGALVSDGTSADAADLNTPLSDIETSFNLAFLRDGRAPATGDFAMGDNQITSLADGSAATDAATVKQAQIRTLGHATSVTGTVDAIVLGFTPAITAWVTGMHFYWVSGGKNTTATPTVNIGPSAKTIKRNGGVALAPNDTGASGYICHGVYNGTDVILVNNATGSVAPGTICHYAGATVPDAGLLCYGQAVSRTTYAALFSAISTTYGTGDGSTTFNLPDVRGRAAFGKDNMGGTSANRITDQSGGWNGDTLGDTGGTETHTLTLAQMEAHQHFVLSADDPSGSPSVTNSNYVSYENRASDDSGDYTLTGTAVAATIGLSSSAGSGNAHNNLPPGIVFNVYIKT